jgi:hypothetical protein
MDAARRLGSDSVTQPVGLSAAVSFNRWAQDLHKPNNQEHDTIHQAGNYLLRVKDPFSAEARDLCL